MIEVSRKLFHNSPIEKKYYLFKNRNDMKPLFEPVTAKFIGVFMRHHVTINWLGIGFANIPDYGFPDPSLKSDVIFLRTLNM